MSLAAAYNAALRRAILRPMVRHMQGRIAKAGQSYKAIRAAIDAIPENPALAKMSQTAAKAHMAKLKKFHTNRFRGEMRRHLGVRVDFMSDNVLAPILEQGIKDNVDLIKTIPKTYHAALKADITKLASAGEAFDQEALSGILANKYKSAGYNLRRLTRDQTTKTIGKLTEARQRQAGIEEYVWRTSEDESVRPTHRRNNTKTFQWANPPPATGHPGHDIQCFPGSVRVAPIGLHGSVSYRYVGQLIQIFLANGVSVTTTPNHPILTESGWKPAGLIDEFDQLIIHRGLASFSTASLNPQFGKAYPTAEDLHGFLGGVGNLCGASCRREDLHGNPATGDEEIEIVNVERELRDRLEASFAQELSNLDLVCAELGGVDVELPFLGEFDQSFTLPPAVSGFVIGGASESAPVNIGQLGHSDYARFGVAAAAQPDIAHAGVDYGSAHVELAGYGQDGNFGFPKFLDSFVEPESAFDVVRPVRISPCWHDGPVYNFETDTGIILSNGIVTHNCRCIALAVIPKLAAQRPKESDPKGLPRMSKTEATVKQLAGQRGSNPGGLYEGADGVTRYVKYYGDPAQSYSEAVANRAYAELGLTVPRSTLIYEGDKVVGVANEIIENLGTLGRARLTKTRANSVLDGFTADVWLGNWDAVGTGLDNVVAFKRGASRYVARIDQGGSLLFRARAGRKSRDVLYKVSEWEGFSSATVNPYYKKVFDAAGLGSADDLGRRGLNQIKAIRELGKRTNNFADLVPDALGLDDADRRAILRMLRERARVLETEIAPRVRAHLKALREAKKRVGVTGYTAEQEKALRDKFGRDIDYLARRGRDRAKSLTSGLTDVEVAMIRAYSTSDSSYGYRPINGALVKAMRGTPPADWKVWEAYRDVLNSALAKLPKYQGTVKRGINVSDKKLIERYRVGQIVDESAFVSTSYTAGWAGNVRFSITSKTGVKIEDISNHPGEKEVLMKAGTKFRVLEVDDRGKEYHITLLEVE